jgi:hypothetical protein
MLLTALLLFKTLALSLAIVGLAPGVNDIACSSFRMIHAPAAWLT